MVTGQSMHPVVGDVRADVNGIVEIVVVVVVVEVVEVEDEDEDEELERGNAPAVLVLSSWIR